MTTTTETEAPEVVEVNRDVACEIYAGSYRRLAGAPAPRFYVTLALDAVSYSQLCALIGTNLKGQAVVHFVNIQAPLPDAAETDPGPENQPELRSASGEAIVAHIFRASAEDALKCTFCEMGETHAIHLTEEQLASRDELLRKRSQNGAL